MSDFTQYAPKLARAVSSAAAADVIASPSIQKAVREGRVSRQGLRSIMMRDLENEARGVKGPALFPHLRSVMRTQMNVERRKAGGGLGATATVTDPYSGIASAIAGAAAGILGAKYVSDANKDIAKIQANTQLQIANLQANSDKLALAAAQGFPSAAAGVPGSTPSWVVPAAAGGAAVVLGIGYMLLRGKGKRR